MVGGLEAREGGGDGDIGIGIRAYGDGKATYECQRIRQQHKPRRIVRQLIAELLHICVHIVVCLLDLERLLIDLVLLGRGLVWVRVGSSRRFGTGSLD